MYDVIIIGAGPAGFSSAIYAARRQMKTLLIAKELGGQISLASEIENYPGFKRITSSDLITKFEEQTKELGVEIKLNDVRRVEKKEDYFKVTTEKEIYKTRTIILALGLTPRRLSIPGEEKYRGKGVSYCANCDGLFFKNKKVAVVGGGNAALDAAEILSKIASQVILIHRRNEFRGFEVLVRKIKEQSNIEILLNTEIKEIKGEQVVKKIIVLNNETEEKKEVELDGVFIEVGRVPNIDLVKDLVHFDNHEQIIVDEKCSTSTEGLFAAGDATQVPFKQITIASGQGTIAALAAYQYLQMKEGKESKIIVDRGIK